MPGFYHLPQLALTGTHTRACRTRPSSASGTAGGHCSTILDSAYYSRAWVRGFTGSNNATTGRRHASVTDTHILSG